VIVANRRLSVAPARTIGGGLLVLVAGALVVGVGPDGAAADELVTREVAVRAEPSEGFGPPPPVVDRLPARTVLRITATGFEPNAAGVIEQCAASGCTNPFPVSFDATGTARLQYLVSSEPLARADSSWSCRAESCVVRLDSAGRTAYLTTVFGRAALPARRVQVDGHDRGLVDGAAVLVTVTGFRPGERVQAMLCAAPATYGTTRCGLPGPVAPFTIDADGTGRTSMVIGRGHVGSEGAQCGRETMCAVVVTRAGRGFAPGAVLPFSFRSGPGARYDGARVVAGLLLVALLVALAAVLVRVTDWRKPTEADAPELDAIALVD